MTVREGFNAVGKVSNRQFVKVIRDRIFMYCNILVAKRGFLTVAKDVPVVGKVFFFQIVDTAVSKRQIIKNIVFL